MVGGNRVTVLAQTGDLTIRTLSFADADLTAAEEGARLHVETAIARASRIVARGDTIVIDNATLDRLTGRDAHTLSFNLAGNDGGAARDVFVRALMQDAGGVALTGPIERPVTVQFDLLSSQRADVVAGVPDLHMMQTLIGQQATFSNNIYRVKLDNELRAMSLGYDALITSTAPFYFLFEADRRFTSNAAFIYYDQSFEIIGSGPSLQDDAPRLLEQALRRRIDPARPVGGVTLTVPGNVLGRNADAIEDENQLQLRPTGPSLGLRR